MSKSDSTFLEHFPEFEKSLLIESRDGKEMGECWV